MKNHVFIVVEQHILIDANCSLISNVSLNPLGPVEVKTPDDVADSWDVEEDIIDSWDASDNESESKDVEKVDEIKGIYHEVDDFNDSGVIYTFVKKLFCKFFNLFWGQLGNNHPIN